MGNESSDSTDASANANDSGGTNESDGQASDGVTNQSSGNQSSDTRSSGSQTESDATKSQKGIESGSIVIRSIYSLGGVILIGLGAAILNVGSVGVDPYTAMNMGIAKLIGWDLGSYQMLSNLILFIPVFIWGRKYIGPGTVINMVLTGYFIDFFSGLLQPLAPEHATLLSMAAFFLVGIIVFDFGASAYMSAGVGTAPYDAIAPIIVDKTGLSYQRVRVPQDILVVIVAVLANGPVGFGTVMTAFFNGPLIQFFSTKFNQPMVKKIVGHHVTVPKNAGAPGDPTKLI